MKKILLTGLLLLLSFTLTSCDELFGPTSGGSFHEHTFKETWETDELKHWHNASCEHTDLTKDLGTHTFNDQGICTICNYETIENFKTFTFEGTNCTCSTLEQYHINDTISLTIAPNESYLLPKTIQVEGLENYTYDKETGVIEGKVVGDIKITAVTHLTNKVYYLSKVEAVATYGPVRTETFEYDLTNNIVKRVQYNKGNIEEASFTNYFYNENNQVIKIEYGNTGNVLNYTEFTYDTKGNKTSELNYVNEDTGPILNRKQTYLYNDDNKLVETKYYGYENGIEVYQKLYVIEYYDGYYIESRYDTEVEPYELYKKYKYVEVIDEEAGILSLTCYKINLTTSEESLINTMIYDIETNIEIGMSEPGGQLLLEFNENRDPTNYTFTMNQTGTEFSFPYVAYTYDDEGKVATFVYNQNIGESSYEAGMTVTYEHNELDLLSKANVTSIIPTTNETGYVIFEYTELDPNTELPSELTKGFTTGFYLGLFEQGIEYYLNAVEPEYIEL